MKFHFPFQKVLDVKTKEKKHTESLLAQAIAEAAEAEKTLKELEAARSRTLQRLNEQTLGGGTLADLIACQDYARYLDERIAGAVLRLKEAEARVEQARIALMERTVEEKIWQKAKEKAYEHFRAEAERLNQNELDDIASVRSRFAM